MGAKGSKKPKGSALKTLFRRKAKAVAKLRLKKALKKKTTKDPSCVKTGTQPLDDGPSEEVPATEVSPLTPPSSTLAWLASQASSSAEPIAHTPIGDYRQAWAEFKVVVNSLLGSEQTSLASTRGSPEELPIRMWQRIRELLTYAFGGKCPENVNSKKWRELLNSLERSRAFPSEDLTFKYLLNLQPTRAKSPEDILSRLAMVRWEQAVWRLTKAICELWEYDPTLPCDSE